MVAFLCAVNFKYNLWLFNILWFSCQNDIKRWNKSYKTFSGVKRAICPSDKPQLFDYRCVHRRICWKVNIGNFWPHSTKIPLRYGYSSKMTPSRVQRWNQSFTMNHSLWYMIWASCHMVHMIRTIWYGPFDMVKVYLRHMICPNEAKPI